MKLVLTVGVCVLALMAGLLWRQLEERKHTDTGIEIVLLTPDGMAFDSPYVEIWADAAKEEGVLLRPMHMSTWVRASSYWHRRPVSGIILPDKFHREVSTTAISQLERYVSEGGRLMLLQDGGLLDEKGRYAFGPSRLSKLAGVVYGEYEQLGGDISHFASVEGLASFLDTLHLPPGRYQPMDAQQSGYVMPLTWYSNERVRVSIYSAEMSKFPVLRTRNTALSAEPLLTTADGDAVAQVNRLGKGVTLFVNLPLTHLKQQTDGVFLHGFLRYFAHEILGQPVLASTPLNEGVLVLNWHNDDRLAIHYLNGLQEAGIFDHGHQSMHFTAGPDVDKEGDGKGMDLPNNPEAQAMVRKLASQGHTIGNHGGWIHNHFGLSATDDNGEDYSKYLDLNNEAVVDANDGKPVFEYSAPQGNQPLWVYDWLAEKKNLAYYTTSNIGAAPTRVWMAEQRMPGGWGFPVMTNGRIASAEEAWMHKVPPAAFGAWLTSVGRFIENERVMRLAYFHPIGATLYLEQVKQLIDQVQRCADRDACRFMSMTEAANFLNRRLATQWHIERQASGQQLKASNEQGLHEMSWLFPKSAYKEVRVLQGQAQLDELRDAYRVRVHGGKDLQLQLTPKPGVNENSGSSLALKR